MQKWELTLKGKIIYLFWWIVGQAKATIRSETWYSTVMMCSKTFRPPFHSDRSGYENEPRIRHKLLTVFLLTALWLESYLNLTDLEQSMANRSKVSFFTDPVSAGCKSADAIAAGARTLIGQCRCQSCSFEALIRWGLCQSCYVRVKRRNIRSLRW